MAGASEDAFANDGEFRVGSKVIEMCERVAVAHKCAPGAVASWRLEIDDVPFLVTVSVATGGS